MNKKKLIALTMILTLLLTSTAFAYADVQPRDTDIVSFNIDRTSRTTATATINVSFATLVDRYVVTMYLQKKVDGVWVSDTSNDDYVYSNTGTNARRFIFNHVYTDLESGVNYRIKCISKDYIGDSSYTLTCYSNQF